MRIGFFAFAAASLLAAPVFAGTLQEVTTKGEIVIIQGQEMEVKFTPDGKFSAFDGQITGTWRIDGERLCTVSNVEPGESCAVYPKDKKSGDTFEVTGNGGSATVKIK